MIETGFHAIMAKVYIKQRQIIGKCNWRGIEYIIFLELTFIEIYRGGSVIRILSCKIIISLAELDASGQTE